MKLSQGGDNFILLLREVTLNYFSKLKFIKLNLKRIDESNFIECFNLKLAKGQDRFVSHPIRILAQAYVYYNQCTPLWIKRERDNKK